MIFKDRTHVLKNLRDKKKPFSTNTDLKLFNENSNISDYGAHNCYSPCKHHAPDQPSQATATLLPDSQSLSVLAAPLNTDSLRIGATDSPNLVRGKFPPNLYPFAEIASQNEETSPDRTHSPRKRRQTLTEVSLHHSSHQSLQEIDCLDLNPGL
jgi:hypothetical protein